MINTPTSLPYDELLQVIADYVIDDQIDSAEAYKTARLCLMDSLGCALQALQYPACTKLLGPIVPGMTIEQGAHVPGTAYELDPVQAAFNFGMMIRWLDYNDTWLAAEWGHPSDNLGGILMVADFISRRNLAQGKAPLLMREVLTALIKAYEIQGVLALTNAFNRVGLDHVLLVKVATAVVVVRMLGGDRDAVLRVLSLAWLDGHSLRTYRHAPNTGSRKSWAAGDATSRAVWLALITLRGEMGYPHVLSTKTWGVCDVILHGKELTLSQPLASYVMENILFKVAFPAEFHAQTAVECALTLHQEVANRLESIEKIVIHTQESAIRIIDKTGPLNNPADRDHCLQYMVAIALLFGELTAEHYEDNIAKDPRIDQLRAKMIVIEEPKFSRDYMDLTKRSIGNAIQVFFQEGLNTEKIIVEYPLGHRQRRHEAIPLLEEKFIQQVSNTFSSENMDKMKQLIQAPEAIDKLTVPDFIDYTHRTSLSNTNH